MSESSFRNLKIQMRSTDSMKFGNLKLSYWAFFKPLDMALAAGVIQAGDMFMRVEAFCWRVRYWVQFLPGLKVVLRSWAVSSVGGRAGPPSRWGSRK